MTIWSTPQHIFDKLNREFGFTLDVCADPENAKCTYFRSGKPLLEDWGKNKCFMNPPYGREISAWIRKAHEASLAGATVVALIPGRTNAPWWHEYVMKADEIRFVRKKLSFTGNDGTKGVPSFGSVIAVFGNKRQKPKISSWDQRRAEQPRGGKA